MTQLDVYIPSSEKSRPALDMPDAPPDAGAGVTPIGVVSAVVGVAAMPAAVALSYTRNASVPWAVAHGLVAVPYVIFRGVQYAIGVRG